MEVEAGERKRSRHEKRPFINGAIRPEGEFSHSVFVVETVAWVGPARQDQAFPVGLLVGGSVP